MDYYNTVADIVIYYNEGSLKLNDFSDNKVAK